MWIVINRRILIGVVLIMVIIFMTGFGIYLSNATTANPEAKANGYIVLIIDDFGLHGNGTDAMINLGIPITAAVIPFLPYSQSDADAVHNAGLEVIMHVPMQPIKGKAEWLGLRSINTKMTEQEIDSCLKDGLMEIKWSVGMNNHMGSKATQDRRVMQAVMKVAKEHNLFYVDSLTSSKSVASEVACDQAIPFFSRDVFLDNSKKQADIESQLNKLADIALQRGYAVGIGHVGPEGGTVTAQAIKTMYPILHEKGIRFINLTQLKDLQKNYQIY